MMNNFESINRNIKKISRLNPNLLKKTSNLLQLSSSNLKSKIKVGANTLKQQAENKKLKFEDFKKLLIYKLIPYCGVSTLAVANDLNIKNHLRLGVCTVFELKFDQNGNPQIDRPQILYEAYRKIKSYFKLPLETNVFNNEKENLIVNLPSTWKEFKENVGKNMTAAKKIVEAFGDACTENREIFFKNKCIEVGLNIDNIIISNMVGAIKSEVLSDDWISKDIQKLHDYIRQMQECYPLTDTDRSTFYMLKLFKAKSVPAFDNPQYGETVKSINRIYSPCKMLSEGSKVIQSFKELNLNPNDNFLSQKAKDKFIEMINDLKSNPNNLIKDTKENNNNNNKSEQAPHPRKHRFDLSLDSYKPKNIVTRLRSRSASSGMRKTSKDSTTSRPRSVSLFSGLRRRHTVSEYVGEMLTKLYDRKPDLLCTEARKIASGDYSDFEGFIALLKSNKPIKIISDTGFTCNVTFPADFENFKNNLLNAKKKSTSLKIEIDTTGKKIRDEWLRKLCESHNLDVHDVRIKKIYMYAIANDRTITTSKRLATVINGMDEAIKDSENNYKHAFYILKLFANGVVTQSEIPHGTGLGNIFSAFYMQEELDDMLKTIDKEHYLNKETRKKIKEEIEKLSPKTNILKPAAEPNEIGSRETNQIKPKGNLTKAEQERLEYLSSLQGWQITRTTLEELRRLQLKSETASSDKPTNQTTTTSQSNASKTPVRPLPPTPTRDSRERPSPKNPVRKPSGRPLPPTPTNKQPPGRPSNLRQKRGVNRPPLASGTNSGR